MDYAHAIRLWNLLESDSNCCFNDIFDQNKASDIIEIVASIQIQARIIWNWKILDQLVIIGPIEVQQNWWKKLAMMCNVQCSLSVSNVVNSLNYEMLLHPLTMTALNLMRWNLADKLLALFALISTSKSIKHRSITSNKTDSFW